MHGDNTEAHRLQTGWPQRRSQSRASSHASAIAESTTRLMIHYWTADETATVRALQLEDWLEDLTEFAPAIVANACRTWRRRADNRRPTPGEIRALCVTERRVAEREAVQERLAVITPPIPIDMDAYAREVGWANNAERMEAIARDKLRRSAEANAERLRQIERELMARPIREHPGAAAASLGVTATEVTEVMRQARVSLGIEDDTGPQPAQAVG